jgi:hypothetical protein
MEGYEYLSSLRQMLHLKREELKEKIAGGIKDHDEYHRYVGQCRAYEWTIEKISDQIKSINSGDEDAADAKPGPRK